MPKRRAASRWLSPSTWQAWRTRPSSSTENIPAFPGSFRTRSKKALSRYSLVPPRPDYPAAVSVAHFVSAALNSALLEDFPVLQRRLLVTEKDSPGYLRSECLVHIIRDARRVGDDRCRD